MTKSFYLWCALALFITEVIIAIYVPSTSFIRHAFGDFLVVLLIYCFAKGIVDIAPTKLVIAVLIFSFTIEFAQYFHVIDLLGIENKVLRIAIGNSFSWNDLLMYTLGCWLIYTLERRYAKKSKQS
ncbi:DUF2809 domain-containing protein [Leucothrix arctica]|uniref:DUF2809 domain-containing protein n=1 Tax=Leucothrix arctica TaxID=1481894 RepID=A0A317CKU5_9GAMM|nr:DUF2809 domain-containing protein [Leucothrix arctica]PWQ96950.1 DUF2809 domain-containing protein [Leucothrix arctica]